MCFVIQYVAWFVSIWQCMSTVFRQIPHMYMIELHGFYFFLVVSCSAGKITNALAQNDKGYDR